MRRILFTFSASIIALLSCSKEGVSPVDNCVSDQITIKGVISTPEDAATRTDYVINELTHKAVFCWKGVEQFSRLGLEWSEKDSRYNIIEKWYNSPAGSPANSGETELSFTGPAVDLDSGYALYPSRNGDKYGNAKMDWYVSAETIYLWLGGTFAYNATAPLSNIVPMLGKLENGEYIFKPITGVLGVQITNIPPTANKVIITSSNHKISDLGFRNSSSDAGSIANELERIYENGGLLLNQNNDRGSTYSKTYTFDAGLDINTTYPFYIPLPAGVLNNGSSDELTIQIMNGNTVLYSKSTHSEITIKNAYITRLPLITLPEMAFVSIEGPSNDIKAQITDKTAGVSYVKVYAAATAEAARANVGSSGTSISSLNTLTSFAGFSDSGEYYVAYQAYDSLDNALTGSDASGVVSVYYLSSEDGGNLVGNYSATYTASNTWGSGNSNEEVKLIAQDCHEGNHLALTYFRKRAYDLEDTPEYNDNKKGSPVYGTLSTVGETKVLTFDASGNYSSSNYFFFSNTWTFYLVGATELHGNSSATSEKENFSFTVGEEGGKKTLTNSGFIDLIFDWKHDSNWYAFWSFQNLKLTHQ